MGSDIWFSLLYFNKCSFLGKSLLFKLVLVSRPENQLAKKKSEGGGNCLKIRAGGIWLAEEALLILLSIALESHSHLCIQILTLSWIQWSQADKMYVKDERHGKTSMVRVGKKHFYCLSQPRLVKLGVQKVSCGSQREERVAWTEAVKRERNDKKGKWRLDAGSYFLSRRAKDWMEIAKKKKKKNKPNMLTGDGLV